MKRIENTFKALRQKNETALVGFITAGDPNLSDSLDILGAMCEAGLDILELGVPFSDPTADGPVIQRSSLRALQSGMNLSKILEMIGEIRKITRIPIIIFSYYNPIYAFGIRRFYDKAAKQGADGVLVVDLPMEESDEMTGLWPGDALSLIRLVAPTTPAPRMAQIAATASGFIYLVSKTGVTGSSGLDMQEIRKQTDLLRAITPLPICVGFGISTASHVAQVASIADGVVIGSAFERLLETNMGKPDLPAIISARVREYKAATIK
ncbi:MAG: tryptophan synthase subunit alpha [Desulfobacterales bacterium]|nr:tryptophan synthase subunit alpha [Desulfobacterales bacterium]